MAGSKMTPNTNGMESGEHLSITNPLTPMVECYRGVTGMLSRGDELPSSIPDRSQHMELLKEKIAARVTRLLLFP